MILKNIVDLIQVRNYVSMMTNNSMVDKKLIRQLYDMQITLDKHIIEKLVSNEFKNQFSLTDEQMKVAVKEATKTNNIKTGMKPNTDTVVVATPGTKVGASLVQTDKS